MSRVAEYLRQRGGYSAHEVGWSSQLPTEPKPSRLARPEQPNPKPQPQRADWDSDPWWDAWGTVQASPTADDDEPYLPHEEVRDRDLCELWGVD